MRLQDEGSQLVAEIAGWMRTSNQKVKRILDACAAPGGKTLILAERNPQARIVAWNPARPDWSSCASGWRSSATGSSAAWPTRPRSTEDAAFDLALADVPCSGTGTLGRNPEIRHRLRL